MARISYGPTVQLRVKRLLEALLTYTRDDSSVDRNLPIDFHWAADNKRLVVGTKLRFLEALTAHDPYQGKLTKGQIREALHCLKDFLEILEDNRVKSKGSEDWHFTLKLWLSDTEENLRQFDEKWTDRKSNRNLLQQYTKINLPRQTNQLIGRKAELERLLKFISLDYRAPIITVDGIGGVGKTALVIEAAYQCLEASVCGASSPQTPVFDSIIFTSAKETRLLPRSKIRPSLIHNTLDDIFRVIANALDNPKILRETGEEQVNLVYENLSKQRTLLIVDNFETVEEKFQEEILSFLSDIPNTTKAVITTREKALLYGNICLPSLSREDSFRLIEQRTLEKGIKLTQSQADSLFTSLSGIPLALIYAVGQLAIGYTLETIVERRSSTTKDLCYYCFKDLVEPLRGKPAHKLLMSLALFPHSSDREAMVEVAGLNEQPNYVVDEGLSQLLRRFLISHQEGRYEMISLTREYALAELAANQDFEKEAWDRRVEWYLRFAQDYGGFDWGEWHIGYDKLEREWGNLLAVLGWCADHDLYDMVKDLWWYLNHFSSLYGYWTDRIFWLNWLIEESEKRAKSKDTVYALSQKSYILIRMGHLKEAEDLLSYAMKLSGPRENWDSAQISLAQHFAVLNIEKRQFDKASQWLDTESELVDQATFQKGEEHDRCTIAINIIKAEIDYVTKKYDHARKLCSDIIEQSKRIGWKRATNDAHNQLVDIAIAQNHLKEAEELLKEELPEANPTKDKRRIAYTQSSWARLEYQRGRFNEARDCATKAMDGFDRLGMKPEAEKMHKLADACCSSSMVPSM